MSTERFKNVTSFVINLLNNKTIILLNIAEYRLIFSRRYSARFRRIIVNCPHFVTFIPYQLLFYLRLCHHYPLEEYEFRCRCQCGHL